MKWTSVLIVGELTGRIDLVGPFDSKEEAEQYGQAMFPRTHWVAEELDRPQWDLVPKRRQK